MKQHTDTERLSWLALDHNTTVGPAKRGETFGVLVRSQHGSGFSANGNVREAIDLAIENAIQPSR